MNTQWTKIKSEKKNKLYENGRKNKIWKQTKTKVFNKINIKKIFFFKLKGKNYAESVIKKRNPLLSKNRNEGNLNKK